MVVAVRKHIGPYGSGGQVKAIGKSLAHVKYIQHRPGLDREEKGREFFSDDRDSVNAREIRKEIREMGNQKVMIQKLMLAPEINEIDKREFAREVMDNLGRSKGLDLKWYAVEHTNTDHHHVHVVVMGKDRNGTDVMLDLKDVEKVKEYGNKYLEREHPRELEKFRDEKEREKREKRLEWERERKQRERDGLELPWMKRKIIREQLEPYEKWREKQDEKEREEAQKREQKDKNQSRDKIDAVGKEWTKANSLEELRGLNERLWDNFDERVPKSEYKKLCGWIKDKEREIEHKNLDKNLDEKGKNKEDRDFIEHNGEKYSRKDPYKKLTNLSKELREGDERLPFNDYQKLRGWIDDRDRNRWQGALEKGLLQAKKEMVTPERPRTVDKAGGQILDPLQEHMMRNPVVGLFMVQAGIANELVRSIELTENRDRLKEGREDLEKASEEIKEREPELEKMTKEDGSREKLDKLKDRFEKVKENRGNIDKGVGDSKEAEKGREQSQKKDKEQKERDDRDKEWFERGGGWGR